MNDENGLISPELVDETEDNAIEREPQPEEQPQIKIATSSLASRILSGDTTTTELGRTATLAEHSAYTVQEVPGKEH